MLFFGASGSCSCSCSGCSFCAVTFCCFSVWSGAFCVFSASLCGICFSTVSVFCSAGCSADVCSFFASAFCSAVFSASGAFSVSFSSVRDTDASPRRIFFSRRFHVSSDAPKSRICASGFCSSYEAVSATAPKSHDTLPLAFTQANPSSSFRTCAR